LGFYFSASATSQDLSGYIYSDASGWISLNCSNTSSCSTIDYKVSVGNNGKLSGYGYSETAGWVNFNPNYGGVSVNQDNTLSGWAYSQSADWLSIDSAKVVSANDLQNDITSANAVINNSDLSNSGTMSLLNSLCRQFLISSECNLLNN
jgi:hypothetical protein